MPMGASGRAIVIVTQRETFALVLARVVSASTGSDASQGVEWRIAGVHAAERPVEAGVHALGD